MLLCACGCGEVVPPSRRGYPSRFCYGHRPWTDPHTRVTVEDRGFETPCWIWQGQTTPTGYGLLRKRHRTMMAHKWFYADRYGPQRLDWKEQQTHHMCNVKACCNPDHMEIVTPAENCRRKASTKLTMEAAREIRASSLSRAALGRKYGVSASTIKSVQAGWTWKEESCGTY